MDIISEILNGRIIIEQGDNSALDSKAGGPAGAIVPQENFTGDVLQGRGPRRGNLERLLRYWRPIMKKPGGFRRCRVILADHPELYPLERICAWLHHETTGLWPNEGCHHPGMKNCKKKLKTNKNGSLWSDREFDDRLRKITSRSGGKTAAFVGVRGTESPFSPVITDADWNHAIVVLQDFVDMEQDFSRYLSNDSNWEHVHGYEITQPEAEALDANTLNF